MSMFEAVPGYSGLSDEDKSTVLSALASIGWRGEDPAIVLSNIPEGLLSITKDCMVCHASNIAKTLNSKAT